MSYTYDTFTATLANWMAVPATNAEFQQALPTIIRSAELRILRELDLLATVTSAQFPLPGLQRSITLPTTGTIFTVVNQVNLIEPADADEDATRTPLIHISHDAIVQLYPSAVGAGTPLFWHGYNNERIIVGPWPAASHTVEVVGTVRPDTLSATETETFISVHLPDVFLAAAMVVASGYQKNFGAQADNPQQAASWENTYKALIMGATMEELRRKFWAQSWSPKSPSQLANPPRS
jgi:hypothetical protein